MTKKFFVLTALVLCFLPGVRAQNVLWSFTTDSDIVASPVVASNGTIYIASYDRYIYALSPGGDVLWTTNLLEPTYIFLGSTYSAVYGTPAVGERGT